MRRSGRVGDLGTVSWPTVLRLLVVLWFVLDLTTGPASVHWWGWPLSLVAATAGLVALVRPLASLVPLAVLLAGLLATRPYPVWQVPMFVSLVTICHRCRPLTVAAVAIVCAPATVVLSIWLYFPVGGVVVLSAIPIGLATRALSHRRQVAVGEIDTLSREVEQVHRQERLALADELSTLLSDSLAAHAGGLAAVRQRTDEEGVALLREVDRSSRAMLARLRRLVTALRPDHPVGPGAIAPTVDAALEAMDEELAGHAFFTEIDDTRDGPMGGRCEDLLARAVMVAAEHVVGCGIPGTTCRVRLGVEGGLARLSVACDVGEGVIPTPIAERTLHEAVLGAGGQMGSTQARGTWTLWLGVPVGSPPQPVATVDAPAPRLAWWQDLRLLQLGLAALAAAMGVLELVRTVSATSPAQGQTSALWLVTWCAIALAPVRPRWGAALLSALWIAGVVRRQPVDGFVPLDLQSFALFVIVGTRRPRWAVAGMATGTLLWLSLVPRGIDLWAAFVHALVGLFGLGPGLVANHFLTTRAEQTAELERLERDLQEAAVGERRLLASELHDIVAHQLSMMSLETGGDLESLDRAGLLALAGRVGRITASARADLDTLVALLRQDAEAAELGAAAVPDRTSTFGLGTPVATARAVAENLERAGFVVTLATDETADDCDPTTARTLARVLREASTNVLRYADPGTSCEVEVVGDERLVTARMSSALPTVDRHDPHSSGLGLEGLAERVRLTGGTFTAGPSLGQWRVACELERFPRD